MRAFSSFTREVKSFSRTNWWVYIIYILLLCIIVLVEKNALLSVSIITSLHFVADIFIMMMFGAYASQQNRHGTYYQVLSMLLFMALKIYTGLIDHAWHYLAADPIYIFAAIKNYAVDIKKSDIKLINYKTMTVLSLFIVAGMLWVKAHANLQLLETPSQWIQTTGIFLFAIALSVTGHEHRRSQLAVTALVAMVAGSAWETTALLLKQQIVGLALSYFLLPLTVLVFYIRNWSSIIHPNKNLGLN
ncbi:MAG: hypothetical protein ABIU63_09095 [Chitinophagaceae bacterium]